MSPAGRKCVLLELSEKEFAEVLNLARGPNTATMIADHVGITVRSLYTFVKNARSGDPKYAKRGRAFLLARLAARQELIKTAQDVEIQSGRPSTSLWLLEKIWPKEFGKPPPQHHTHSGPKGGPIKHSHEVTADELCDAIDALAGRIAASTGPEGSASGDRGDAAGSEGGDSQDS